jgi:hypothetical protein
MPGGSSSTTKRQATNSPPLSPTRMQFRKKFRRMSGCGSSSGEFSRVFIFPFHVKCIIHSIKFDKIHILRKSIEFSSNFMKFEKAKWTLIFANSMFRFSNLKNVLSLFHQNNSNLKHFQF